MMINFLKLIVLTTALCFQIGCRTTEPMAAPEVLPRQPANVRELLSGSKDILKDVENPRLFNIGTCVSFVNKVTDYLYYLPADYFVPKNAQDVAYLKKNGEEVLNTIFGIRLALHERVQDFSRVQVIPQDCVQKIRQGFQYARFAEEYLLDWMFTQGVYKLKPTLVMSNSKPNTWTNPKYKNFKIKTGDVFIIRGKSHISAMIARIGDEEGNFSHMAIIGEDKQGNQYAIEALIQSGTIITPLQEWRRAQDARLALYRQPDAHLAQVAGRMIYEKAQGHLRAGEALRYDFAMDDSNYDSFFCSEVTRYAYDKASDGKFMVPFYRSSVSKFKNSEYPKSLGITKTTLFAPYDIEVDPRFELVAEHRYFPLLRQVRMQDAILQSVYEWMTQKGYSFHWDPGHAAKALAAKVARQAGFVSEILPKYMPLKGIQTSIQFESVAKDLEENLYAKEKKFYAANGFSPSFHDMMAINEKFRKDDCLAWQEDRKMSSSAGPGTVRFHYVFRSSAKSCE